MMGYFFMVGYRQCDAGRREDDKSKSNVSASVGGNIHHIQEICLGYALCGIISTRQLGAAIDVARNLPDIVLQ